jgi:hypothetical protein
MKLFVKLVFAIAIVGGRATGMTLDQHTIVGPLLSPADDRSNTKVLEIYNFRFTGNSAFRQPQPGTPSQTSRIHTGRITHAFLSHSNTKF